MKKVISEITAILLLLCSTACGESQLNSSVTSEESSSTMETAKEDNQTEKQTSESSESSEQETEFTDTNGETLVVYFSATGNTKSVAEKIAYVTNADIYEIVPSEPYSDSDLNYNDDQCRANIEMNDPNARPEIAGDPLSLENYTTIYLGYPIWWGDAPRIMDTFVESYDFSDKTVIPFCTSGGSSIDQSESSLKDLASSGNWIAGSRLNNDISEEKIQEWINGMN